MIKRFRGLYLLIIALFLNLPVLAGQNYSDQEMDAVPTAGLIARAKQRDPKAIRKLGLSREQSAKSLLIEIAEEPDLPENKSAPRYRAPGELAAIARTSRVNRAHLEAKVSLARLGEIKYLNEFIEGLSSPNDSWRRECIRELGAIGDKRAAKNLIPILDDTRVPENKSGFLPFSNLAANALREIFPDTFQQFVKNHSGRGKVFRDDWKQWWAINWKSIENE